MAEKIAEIRRRLRAVRGKIRKRGLRVQLRKAQQRRWRKRLDAAVRQGRPQNADRAQRKLAHYNELLDKAMLGRREYEARERRLQKKLKHLLEERDEAKPADGVVVPDAPWNPYKRPIAAWIVHWLEKSWAAGWRGQVNSGWRDPAYSESLCRAMCGAPSCPGRCAGRASNHSGSSYPAGAIDVSDYYTFGAVQRRIGSPLHNALGAQDPVHFSVSGR